MTETVLFYKDSLKQIPDFLIGLLYPLRCPVCDRPVRRRADGICPECLRRLKPINGNICEKCGKKLSRTALIKRSGFCHDCEKKEHAFTRSRSAFEYSCAKEMIYRFKYAGRREYARIFAKLTERILADYIYGNDFDLIACVPVSKERLLQRGYNQASELGRELSIVTGIPFSPDALIRIKNTVPLKMLNPSERQNNLKNAFKTGKNVVKFKRILLVDDIYTTGATLDECAKVLLESGALCVYGVTLSSGAGL